MTRETQYVLFAIAMLVAFCGIAIWVFVSTSR